MDWIKRNLYFLIGGLVALVLMGLAGWYQYSKWQLNNDILGELDKQYAELKRLYEQKPHPGSPPTDNIKAAQDQQQELRAYMQKSRQYFQRCPPIPVPESKKLTSQEFSSALSRTVDQLQREATNASITLPAKDSKGQTYSFSFSIQRNSLAYAAGSLEPLSVQLGEIKVLCSVLFQAKINELVNLRREHVSDDDQKGPQSDYLTDKSVTNELAVLAPYEVTFKCFSSELAAVLAGLASSPYGLMVKSINVEAAPAPPAAVELPMAPVMPVYQPPPVYYPPTRAGDPAAAAISREMMMRRYMGGVMPPMRPPPQQYVPPVAPVAPPANKGGLPMVLDEKLLKVTLTLVAVKLIPPK